MEKGRNLQQSAWPAMGSLLSAPFLSLRNACQQRFSVLETQNSCYSEKLEEVIVACLEVDACDKAVAVSHLLLKPLLFCCKVCLVRKVWIEANKQRQVLGKALVLLSHVQRL